MQPLLDVAGQLLMVAGSLLFVVAGVGLVRLKDAYARMAAVSSAAGMGVTLVLLGAFALQPGPANAVKVAVAILLQLVTSSVATMAIARSAYLTGCALHPATAVDDLAQPGRTRGTSEHRPSDGTRSADPDRAADNPGGGQQR